MKNEFTFEIEARQIKTVGTHYNLKAKESECQSLAKRFNLVGLKYLTAEVDVKAESKHDFIVSGSLKALIRQTCGISLEDFDKELKGDFEELFTTKKIEITEAEMDLDAEIPNEVVDGIIDIGEVVSEQLALLIPVFPKKDGMSFKFKDKMDKEEPIESPFSVLKTLKK